MHTSKLIKRLLRIDKIVIEDVYFEPKLEDEVCIIVARPQARDTNRCPICHKRAPGYDCKHKKRRWRSLDFGAQRVYIEAGAPRVECAEHGVLVAQVPWARHDSSYTYDFETAVTWFALHATALDVADYFRINWHSVGSIAKRVQESLENSDPARFDNLEAIGIDETSYKKGHKYMTVVVDHKTGGLIWAQKGYGKEVLSGFFMGLAHGQREKIKYVTADGARWISDCIADFCPNAERCVDPFHVVGWATGTLDEVRKSAIRLAKKGAVEREPPKKKTKAKLTNTPC